jgi:hypothetical protein
MTSRVLSGFPPAFSGILLGLIGPENGDDMFLRNVD